MPFWIPNLCCLSLSSYRCLQDVLKCFSHYPDNFLDIVRNTDPSTVTQHGLYIRELTHDHHNSPVCPQVISSLPQQTGQDAAHSRQKPVFHRESPQNERQKEKNEAGQGISRQSPQIELAPNTPQQHYSSEKSLTGQGHQQANNITQVLHTVQNRQPASNVTAGDTLNAPAAQDLDQVSPQVVVKAGNSKENIACASSFGMKQGKRRRQVSKSGVVGAWQGDPAGRCRTCNCPKWSADCIHLTTAYMYAPHLTLFSNSHCHGALQL